MSQKLLLLLPIVASLCSPAAVQAQSLSPAARGQQIIAEVNQRSAGFHDFKAELSMLLHTPTGEKILQKMRFQTLETPDGSKTTVVLDGPADMQGTAVLTHAHMGVDEQWLYLPALKQVKYIEPGGNKSSPLLDSDFTSGLFQACDLKSQLGGMPESVAYKYIRDDVLNGQKVFVVELSPTDQGSAVQRLWVNQDLYRVERIEFFDRKGSKLKTMALNGYQQYQGKYWRPSEMVMDNHQTGKKTTLNWSNYAFQAGLTDKDFTVDSLRKFY